VPAISLTITADGRTLFDEPRRGIAKTTIALYRELAVIRPAWRFRVFYAEGTQPNPFADLPNVSCERLRMKGDRFDLWPRVRLPLANLVARPQLFHAPAGVAPRFPCAPLVTTVHDLIPLEVGRTDAPARAWAANIIRAARRARAIIAPSEFSKGRVVYHCGVDPAKVHVVPWASTAGPPTATADEIAAARARYGVPAGGRYVLHFGMADPRKNTAGVLGAWAKLPATVRAGARLVVVGVSDTARADFTARWHEFACGSELLEGTVGIFGYAPEADVDALLAGAAVLAYPTTYEGFGLPILDGFAAGVPVLTGDATSLPEVAGDAALCVDAADPAALAAGLARLLQHESARADYRRRGEERAAAFTWRRTAELTARVWEWSSSGVTPAPDGP
jgi:glycosyltransferase involved in cell wall biosynthesis